MKELEIRSADYLYESIVRFVDPAARPTVLDVGSGRGAYHSLLRGVQEIALIDAFAPYLADRQRDFEALGVNVIPLHGRAELILAALRVKYDVALAIDFIEHLEKETASEVIGRMLDLSKRVAIFTPYGLHPQTVDRKGEGADYWQTRRSSWLPPDLESMGFEVEVWRGFHDPVHRENPEASPDAIWATWRK